MIDKANNEDALPKRKFICLSWREASKATILLAGIFIVLGYMPTYNRYLHGISAESDLYRRQYHLMDMHSRFVWKYGAQIATIATGLTLLIRAFLPLNDLVRTSAVIIGGFIFYFGFTLILSRFYHYGFHHLKTTGLWALIPLFAFPWLGIGLRTD
jgi:hypothetical protein